MADCLATGTGRRGEEKGFKTKEEVVEGKHTQSGKKSKKREKDVQLVFLSSFSP